MSEEAARKTLSPTRRSWLRRQANHIVAQLPEDEEEALIVLEYARRLVEEFLGGDTPPSLKSVGDN